MKRLDLELSLGVQEETFLSEGGVADEVCLNGTFMLEQPFSSFFEWYPRWRDLVQMLQTVGGPHTVP